MGSVVWLLSKAWGNFGKGDKKQGEDAGEASKGSIIPRQTCWSRQRGVQKLSREPVGSTAEF